MKSIMAMVILIIAAASLAACGDSGEKKVPVNIQQPSGTLTLEQIAGDGDIPRGLHRMKVPGGWLVIIKTRFTDSDKGGEGAGIAFYPDPNYSWRIDR